tara:strand:+ start:1099 stop:1440 length:342 start_codon:yes stop_codon:yes gene_type:complete
MMEEQVENWMEHIRSMAPVLERAIVEKMIADADVKRIKAKLMTLAVQQGHKTAVAQDNYAENQPELYEARLNYAKCSGIVESVKLEVKGREIGFDEWRTRVVNEREERKKYGA